MGKGPDKKGEIFPVDHVEIEDVIIISTLKDVTSVPVYTSFGVVMPVFVRQDREIRSPMMRMFFIQVQGKWRYIHSK